jgi:hypothetical protein
MFSCEFHLQALIVVFFSLHLFLSQIKAAIRSLDVPPKSRPQPISTSTIITAAQLQVVARCQQQPTSQSPPLSPFSAGNASRKL